MTLKAAQQIFAAGMRIQKTRALRPKEKMLMTRARQKLRQDRKPNPHPIKIYEKVTRIEAQKGPGHICDAGCKKAQHRYYHDFKSTPSMYGLADGSLLITKGKP